MSKVDPSPLPGVLLKQLVYHHCVVQGPETSGQARIPTQLTQQASALIARFAISNFGLSHFFLSIHVVEGMAMSEH